MVHYPTIHKERGFINDGKVWFRVSVLSCVFHCLLPYGSMWSLRRSFGGFSICNGAKRTKEPFKFKITSSAAMYDSING